MIGLVHMNDTQIKNFITLAKIGSFSKAESILNTTRTALKKQMDVLESELGFPLFFRTAKGLQLTECGQQFLTRVNQLYLEFSSVVRECQSLALHRRKIRVGIYAVSRMQKWYTNIAENSDFIIEYVYLSGENITHEGNLQLLKDKKIDFLEYEDNQLIYNAKLLFRKIDTDRLCCIMQNNHTLAQKTAIHMEDLAGYDIYCWTSDSSATRALTEHARRMGLNLQMFPYSKSNVLNICHSGNIYILSHTLAIPFRPLKVIPIVPKIPYYRGLVYLPENEALLNEMLAAAPPHIL